MAKKLYTVIARTKAEYGSGSPPATAAVTSFTGLQAAKTAAWNLLAGGTVSYASIYGPDGIVAKRVNAAGA